MTKRQRESRVYLSSEGKAELSEMARPWIRVGDLGAYLLCRKVDATGAYLQMTVEVEVDGEDAAEIDLHVPHRFIRGFLSMKEPGAFDALYGAAATPRAATDGAPSRPPRKDPAAG